MIGSSNAGFEVFGCPLSAHELLLRKKIAARTWSIIRSNIVEIEACEFERRYHGITVVDLLYRLTRGMRV